MKRSTRAKQFGKRCAAALGLLTLFGTSIASAASFRLQATTGHPWVSSSPTWKTIHDQTNFTVQEGTVSLPGQTSTAAWWIIPLPLSSTDDEWTVKQFVDSGSGTIATKICAFESDGSPARCSTTTTNGNTRSIKVPLNGTAYTASSFVFPSGCGQACAAPEFHGIIISN